MISSHADPYIRSVFTRSKGFTNIKTKGIPARKAQVILNSFIPQGSSPPSCVRIGYYDNMVGAGYYFMKNASDAYVSTHLEVVNPISQYLPFMPPLTESQIAPIAEGIPSTAEGSADYQEEYNFFRSFNETDQSTILYSLLSGDNIIIVHNEHNHRLSFIQSLLRLMPRILLKYNRITSSCQELDGNENIIGVPTLPERYRSYRALHMPLDTIFIDLQLSTVIGDGMKISPFCRSIIHEATGSYGNVSNAVGQLVRDIITHPLQDNIDGLDSDAQLYNTMRMRLGLSSKREQNWFAEF